MKMRKVEILYLRMMELALKLIGKDAMECKLKRYRGYGAKIGNNVRTFSPISSAESYLINIGDNVTISSGVRFITHDNSAIKIYPDATDFVGEIHIGNNVFIGANSIILPGVTIADDCIVGAGGWFVKAVMREGLY